MLGAIIRYYVVPILQIAVLVLLVAAGVAAGAVYFFFGGGQPYTDLTGLPVLDGALLEPVVTSDRPVGNVAVSADGRIFYTIHPEARPAPPVLFEWVDGAAVPWPSAEGQAMLQAPLGLVVDRQNRLWVIDSGNHGFGAPKLVAFDLGTGAVAHRHDFAGAVAPWGSFLQDLQVDSTGIWVYIADTGFWAKRPALIVYNVETGQARRVLSRHETTLPKNYLIRTPIRDMSYYGGLLSLKAGMDGLALSRDDAWLYYAAMNHDTLYRAPTFLLQNPDVPHVRLAVDIEIVAEKPLSDGLSIDDAGTVYVTDVEHGAIHRVTEDGDGVRTRETLIRDPRIRWADGLSFGPDGWLYLADSAVPHLILQSPDHIAAEGPYTIWRFPSGATAPPGQ